MRFNVGDIVEVKLADGSKIQGHVLYISEYFQDVIGTVFPINGGAFEVQYTNVKAAKHYGWKIIGHREITKNDLEKTKRIVGGEVYVGDQMTRSATEDDWKSLPRMLVKGMPIILDDLQLIVANRNVD
jgi:ribosomal protein L21E